MVMKNVTKVRVDGYTAEHRPESPCLMQHAGSSCGDTHPPRVDIWRGVTWVGQWFWVPETGMGDRRQTPSGVRAPDETTIGKLAHALRERGV